MPIPAPGQKQPRAITDRLLVKPVLGTGGPVTASVRPYFCVCSKLDGTPITDPETCSAPPFHCRLDPEYDDDIEAPNGDEAPPTGYSTWHPMTVTGSCPFSGCAGRFAVTYPGPERELGTWLYAEDNARWLASGFFDAPQPHPGWEPGTDLAGVLWLAGNSPVGREAHALGPDRPGCPLLGSDPILWPLYCRDRINDHYSFGVAPDRRVGSTPTLDFDSVHDVVLTPDFSGSSGIGEERALAGEDEDEPRAVVTVDRTTREATYWLSGGRRFDAEGALPAELRAALVDPGLRWLDASEPSNVTHHAAAPRALAVSSDGTGIAAALERTAEGWTLGTGGPACAAGEILVQCAAGQRCAVPCDGAIGDDRGSGSDATCRVVARATVSDEDLCVSPVAPPCAAGTVRCLPSTCVTPCDGVPGCSPNGQIGDEGPATCGGAAQATLLSGAPITGDAWLAASSQGELPPPRAGFAAAYSRLHGLVSLAGGESAPGVPLAEVHVLFPNGWQRGVLPSDAVPVEVEAAAYAWRERRVWLIDRGAPGGGPPGRTARPGGRRLFRVDPTTGHVATLARLRSLDDARHVWLLASGDGRLLLAAAFRGHWQLALLSAQPFVQGSPISVDGVAIGGGELAAPPRLLRGRVTGALARTRHGRTWLDVRHIATLDDLHPAPTGLAHDLR